MPRKKSPTLTEAELRVMTVLWSKGEASVRDVIDALGPRRKPAYTTVLTVLRVLTAKGYVAVRSEERAHVFHPVISRAQARASALKQMLATLFGGSTEALAEYLIESDTVDAAKLRELEVRLRKQRRRRG